MMPTPEAVQVQPTVSSVLAAALGNILAGTGLGLMVAVVLILIGVEPVRILMWSLSSAAFWSGLIMCVWFSRDEVRNWRKFASMQLDIEELEDDNAALEDAIATIEQRNEYLARENARLTLLTNGKTNFVPAEAASDPVRKDAQTLIDVWAGQNYTPPSFRQMQASHNWSQSQFSAARNFLIAANVIDANATRSHWKVSDKAAAQDAIGVE